MTSPSAARAPRDAHRAAEPGADDLRLQALQWQVMLWSGEVTEVQRRDFDAWLCADPAHRAAWEAIGPLQGRLASLTDPKAAAQALRKAGSTGQRRLILRSMLAGLAAGGVAYGVQRTPQWQLARSDHHTARGEIRAVTLDDGSLAILNTASGLDIRFTAQERRIRLIAGEILVRTAPDPLAVDGVEHRPLRVQTAHGTLQAVGTEFAVRQLDGAAEGQTHVAVLQGAVLIQPDNAGTERIDAGQQTRFGRMQVDPVEPLSPDRMEWRHERLMAEQMRLQDFANELARYRAGLVQVDPAVADLSVSGSYPLADTDHILQALQTSLSVRVRYLTPYWVRITAR